MDELRASVRELADCVRDLAVAHAAGIGARDGLRAESQARGDAVTAAVKSHNKATSAAIEHLAVRVDAFAVQVQAASVARLGAPWWLVATLIAAIIVESGAALSLYAQANDDDAAAAFRDGAALLPLPASTPAESP